MIWLYFERGYIEKFMSKENTELKKAGLKATLPRIRILEALESSDNRHLSAEDIYKQLITLLAKMLAWQRYIEF